MATPQTDPATGLPYTFPTLDTTTGKVLTRPSRPIDYGVKASTLVTAFDSGHEQRRIKAPPRRTFEFNYNYLSATEYATIRAFFLKVMNCYCFNWLDPVEKVTYVVRFDMEIFVAKQKYHGPKGPGYELAVKLMRVL